VHTFAGQHPNLLHFDPDAARRGLAAARFEGRLETVQEGPLVLLDGAHNAEKMAALACALEEAFSYGRLFVVIGMLRSKQADASLRELAPLTHHLIATRTPVKGKPTLTPAELAAEARRAGMVSVQTVADPLAAVRAALAQATPTDLIVVTGSLYLLGAVRGLWYPTAAIEAQGTPFPA
jgi:dihydrofolate synthase/folylpolyglutamate synthase